MKYWTKWSTSLSCLNDSIFLNMLNIFYIYRPKLPECILQTYSVLFQPKYPSILYQPRFHWFSRMFWNWWPAFLVHWTFLSRFSFLCFSGNYRYCTSIYFISFHRNSWLFSFRIEAIRFVFGHYDLKHVHLILGYWDMFFRWGWEYIWKWN